MSEQFWRAKIQGLLQRLASVQQLERDEGALLAAASDRALFGLLHPLFSSTEVDTVKHLLSAASLPFNCRFPSASDLQALIEQHSPCHSVEPSEGASGLVLKQQFWWLWRCLPEVVAQQTNETIFLYPAFPLLPDASLWSHASLTAALSGALAGYEVPSAQPASDQPDPSVTDRPYLAIFSFTPIQELIKASRKMRDFWAGSWVLHYLSAKICWKLANQFGPDSLIYPSLFQQPLIDHWLLQSWEAGESREDWSTWISRPSTRQLLTAGFPNVIVTVLPGRKVQSAMQTARQVLNQAWLTLGSQVQMELQQRGWMTDRFQAENRTWNGWLRSQWQPYWVALPLGHPSVAPIQGMNGTTADLSDWVDQQNRLCHLDSGQALFHPTEYDLLTAIGQHLQLDADLSVNAGSWWPYVFDELRFALNSVKSARVWQLPTAFGPRSTISGFGPVVYPADRQRQITETDTSQFWGESFRLELAESDHVEELSRRAGLFDGREQLNASETLKRALSKILSQERVLGRPEDEIAEAYPDLTAGVAGYLRVHESQPQHRDNFRAACQAIMRLFDDEGYQFNRQNWVRSVIREMRDKWGIPWMDAQVREEQARSSAENRPQQSLYHPRLLNAGWLVEDAVTPELNELRQELRLAFELADAQRHVISTSEPIALASVHPLSESRELPQSPRAIADLKRAIKVLKDDYRSQIQAILDVYYPNNNPADWYVLAAGDGDGMRDWLKGEPLQPYREYMNSSGDTAVFEPIRAAFDEVQHLKKRMGPSTHYALSRALLDFSNQLVPYLTEQRYAGRLIYSGGDDVLAYTNLWEWDQWLWDIRQCFRGDVDESREFVNSGDYWRLSDSYQDSDRERIAKRPLFTMGRYATISFGIVIAHHSVPLAIALEHLWMAEDAAKAHDCPGALPATKDAVQVRVLYGNGNQLVATSKFMAFQTWKSLLTALDSFPTASKSALFEKAAQLWSQHPVPSLEAIAPWTHAFCSRRDLFDNDDQAEQFRQPLAAFLQALWSRTMSDRPVQEIVNWLKLAAFVSRNREVTLPSISRR